jgi:thioredoxin-related protein
MHLAMSVRLMFLLLLRLLLPPVWHYNLEEAKQIAKAKHKHILLAFSGSDWCGPCIQLHKEIFESPVFVQMADTQLVLVQADFPRLKKNKLSAAQQDLNNAAADRYNSQGKFPYTLLLDANGKVLRVWDGFPNMSPEAFTVDVRNGIYADR